MILEKGESPLTNIFGMTKKEVIYNLFINRKDIVTPDGAITLYHKMLNQGIIEEFEPQKIRMNIKDIPKDVLDNMQENIATIKKNDNKSCYIERHKNFNDDLVKDIDKILGDKKEESDSPPVIPVTDEEFKKIISKNANIKI